MFYHLLKIMWNKRRANGLLFLEIILAFIVLFGVYAFGFYNLERYASPLGFKTEELLGIEVDLDDGMDSLDALDAIRIQERIKRDIRTIPGVEAVTFVGPIMPFQNSTWGWGNDKNGFDIHTHLSFADTDYAQTLELELRDGRWFEHADENAKYQPMIVNGAFVDTYFPNAETMVDSVLLFEGPRRIIGIVEDYKYQSNFTDPYPLIFFPPQSALSGTPYENLIVRTAPGRLAEVEEPIYRLLVDVTENTNVTIWNMDTARKTRNRPIMVPLVIMSTISAFLLINIALGLFGVLFTQINRRRAEIGLRKAMGATPGEITAQFVGEVLIVTAAGLLLGTFFAVQVPLLELLPIPGKYFYFGIAAAIATILVIVTLCALIPSRQAAGLHPATVLHEE